MDKQSIAEAKAAADNLQKHFQKIADPKIRFQAQKQRRQKARQQADDARFNDKPRDTKEMKAQRAAEKQKARDERANLRAQQQIQKRQKLLSLNFVMQGCKSLGLKENTGLMLSNSMRPCISSRSKQKLLLKVTSQASE